MIKLIYRIFVAGIFALALTPITGHSEQLLADDIYNGYYSKDGNDGKSAKGTGHSLYIKFYPDRRVVLLYIPYPYSKSVPPADMHQVFINIKKEVDSVAFVKGTFELLTEPATINMENYSIKNNRAEFKCGGGGTTCVTEFLEGGLQVVKTGILGKHIIRYTRIGQ